MVGLTWKDKNGTIQHYLLQHHFNKADAEQGWVEIRKLVEDLV